LTESSEGRFFARDDRPRGGSVLIIGVGSVGSYLADELAYLGIRLLSLVDKENLADENIIRHVLKKPDVGKPKATTLAKEIGAGFPPCTTKGLDVDFLGLDEQDQLGLINQVDLVVGATDNDDCQRRINELCIRTAKPAVYPAFWSGENIIDAEAGHVLRVIPGESGPCYACARNWLPRGVEVGALGGNGADIRVISDVAAKIIIGILHPDDIYESHIEEGRTATIVHALYPPSDSIAHLFAEGNTRPVRVSLPPNRCPICGGQATPLPRPARVIQLTGPVAARPTPTPVPTPSPTSTIWGDFSGLAVRTAWLLGTIGLLLILIRIDQAAFAGSSSEQVGFLVFIDIAVVAFGLFRTFSDNDFADRSEPAVTWGALAGAVVLFFVGIGVLAASQSGTPAQASSSSQQPTVAPVVPGGSASSSAQPAESTAGGSPAANASSLSPAASSLSQDWSSGQQVDSNGNYFTSISCPTVGFCMAVDYAGYAYTYTDGTWSSGQQVDSNGATLLSVSCPDTTFCAAITSGATAYIYSNGDWSSSSLEDGAANLTAISCPVAGYCVATGDWTIYTYSNGAWGTGDEIQEQNYFTAISCPTTSFCIATDDNGDVYTEAGDGSWSAPQSLDNGSRLTEISCPSTSFCVAITQSDAAYIDLDGAWSSSSLVGADGGAANLTAVSCPTAGYCVATGINSAYLYTGSSWSPGSVVQANGFTAVSCPTTRFCMAADGNGNVFSYSES